MTAVEELYAYMESRGIRLGGLTLGPNPGSAEDVARCVLMSLKEVEEGKAEEVATIGY